MRLVQQAFCILQNPVPKGLAEVQGLQNRVGVAGVAKILEAKVVLSLGSLS